MPAPNPLGLVSNDSIIPQTKIYGEINLPDSVELNVGIYQNTLVELDPVFFYTWKKLNSINEFDFSFTITKPEIIEFYLDDKRRYRIYVEPESVNKIIVNESSITIEGPTENENILLRDLGFNKASLKQPLYSKPFELEKGLDELETICDSMNRSLNLTGVSDDFKDYIKSELFGFNYFWKSSLLNKFINDTIAIDTLPQTVVENIRSLYAFDLIDESRSRYYLNSASKYFRSLIKLQLSKKEESNFPIYITSALNKCDHLFSAYPSLHGVILTSIVNSAVYLAKNQSDIEFSEFLYGVHVDNVPDQKHSFIVIKADLDRKVKRFNLNKLDDFRLIKPNDSLDSLSSHLTSKINIINFWASWCRPCIEKMPELISHAEEKNVNLLNVNIWSSKASWKKLIEENDGFDTNALFADKENSIVIAESCSITQFPIYIVVDENLNILSLIESFPDVISYMSSLE